MKKFWKTLGIGISLIVLALAGIMGKLYYETRNMVPLDTQEVAPGVYAVQDTYVNLFLVKNGDNYIAIDAGTKAENVQTALVQLGIDPRAVKAVFLTHSDADHVGGLSLFDKAVIYLPKPEQQMVNGQTPRFLYLKNRLDHGYELLEEGRTLQVSGLTIQGISTPGHTPGSFCYRVNDTYLFTGDSMSLKNGEVHGFNDLFNMDSNIQQKSLGKLAYLTGVEVIFTAHYGFANNFQKAFQHWKK